MQFLRGASGQRQRDCDRHCRGRRVVPKVHELAFVRGILPRRESGDTDPPGGLQASTRRISDIFDQPVKLAFALTGVAGAAVASAGSTVTDPTMPMPACRMQT